MTENKLHPRDVGFQLAVDVSYSDGWEPTVNYRSDELMRVPDIVYVALGVDDVCLRVGQTGGALTARWEGVLKDQIPAERNGRRSYREHEWAFRDKWRSEGGARRVQFWIKRAHKIKFDYLGTEFEASVRGAEEIYLDRYYQPTLSVALDGRR